MFGRSVPVVALLFSLTALPLASAYTLPSTNDMGFPTQSSVIEVWRGHTMPLLLAGAMYGDALAPNLPTGAVSDRLLTLVHPLGDVNKDGKADVLLETFNPKTLTATYQALNADDLTATLWTIQGAKDRILGGAADLDGDGILDPLVVTASATVGGVSSGAVGPATTQTGRITQELAFSPLAGVTGKTRFDSTLHQQLDVSAASSQLMRVVGGGENKTSQEAAQLLMAGQGAFATFDNVWNTTRASATLPIQPATSTTVDADAVVKVLDLTGKVTGTIMLKDPNVNPLEIATNDILKDGTTKVLVLSLSKVGQNQELPAGVPRIQAFTDTGTQLWMTQLDALAGVPSLTPSLGDLDADGKIDLGVLESKVGADVRSTTSTFVLLSGVDGTVKGSLSAPGSALAVVPFGKLAAAKGAATGVATGTATSAADMALGVAENATNHALQITAMAGGELKTVWTLPLTPGTLPLNEVTDPLTGNLQGFTDLTHDGVPDLLVGLGGPATPGLAKGLEMTLYSGVDGKVAWSRHFAGATAAAVLSNAQAAAGTAKSKLTGAAAGLAPPQVDGRLAVVTKAGPEAEIQAGHDANASIVMTTYNLTTGLPIWELPILSAAQATAESPKLAVGTTVSRLGDVNGDGVEDMELRTEHHLDGNLEGVPVARTGGTSLDASTQTVAQTRIVSGSDGKVLWAHTDETANGTTTKVPLEDLKARALSEEGSIASKAGFTALPVVLVAVTIALVALRRRP